MSRNLLGCLLVRCLEEPNGLPHEAVIFGLFSVKLNGLVKLVAVAAEVVVLAFEENIAELVLNFVLFTFLGQRNIILGRVGSGCLVCGESLA